MSTNLEMLDEAPVEVEYTTTGTHPVAVFKYRDGHERVVTIDSDEAHATALALCHRMGIHF